MNRFVRILLVIMAVAFAVRVGYIVGAKSDRCVHTVRGEVVGSSPSKCATGDELFYNGEANALARGKGFTEPYYTILHPGATSSPPAADHPPLTVMVLAPVSWIAEHPPVSWVIKGDDDHMREHRYTMAVLGTLLVGLIGLLGRRIGGDTTGLTAAGIAALLPTLWVNDALVMSETITGVTVVASMLAAFALWRKPTAWRAFALGAMCGLAALSRAELILFVPLLGVAVACTVRIMWSERIALAAAAVFAALLVIAPWVVYNNARFNETTFLSTNDGLALVGSNCKPVYYGSTIGLTNLGECLAPYPTGDQSEVEHVWRSRAIDYMKDHKGRVPIVMAARIGRTWSLFRPIDMVKFNVNEDREEWVTRLGLAAYYPVLLAAIAGAVVLWRRRERGALWVLCVPAIAVTAGVAITYGQTRFRAAAEPSLALLAAVAVVAAVRSLGARARADDADQSEPAEEAV